MHIEQLEPVGGHSDGEEVEELAGTDLQVGLDGVGQVAVNVDGELDGQVVLLGADRLDSKPGRLGVPQTHVALGDGELVGLLEMESLHNCRRH